jgi:hypothetical protein
MNTATMERAAAFLAGCADLGALLGEVRRRMKESARGDDVLAATQQPAHLIHIHEQGRVEHAVRLERHDRIDIVGGNDTRRCDARDISGILAGFVRIVHQHADQIEHGIVREVAQRYLADIARHPLDNPVGLVRHRVLLGCIGTEDSARK